MLLDPIGNQLGILQAVRVMGVAFLDSPVSLDYYDEAPFSFNGSIGRAHIEYLKND